MEGCGTGVEDVRGYGNEQGMREGAKKTELIEIRN